MNTTEMKSWLEMAILNLREALFTESTESISHIAIAISFLMSVIYEMLENDQSCQVAFIDGQLQASDEILTQIIKQDKLNILHLTLPAYIDELYEKRAKLTKEKK